MTSTRGRGRATPGGGAVSAGEPRAKRRAASGALGVRKSSKRVYCLYHSNSNINIDIDIDIGDMFSLRSSH